MASHDEPRSPSSALLQMAQAYRQSAILMTACELKVFTYLSQGPMRAEALAHHCQVPVRGLQRLLNACVVLELLEKEDESYHNTPIAETFLVQGKSGYMGNFIAGWSGALRGLGTSGPGDSGGSASTSALRRGAAIASSRAHQRLCRSLYELGKPSGRYC